MEQKGGGRQLGLSIFGLLLFLLSMPLFLQMGGGQWLLAEVLPGQVPHDSLSIESLRFERTVPKEMDDVAVWGVKDVEFQQKDTNLIGEKGLCVTAEVLEKMKDFSYLKSNFYTIDSRTSLLEGDINVSEALSMDFSIKPTLEEPRILIFHTHTHEDFVDSDMSKGLQEGICGVGEELKDILEKKYGISVLHDMNIYDAVNGVLQREGAYERSGPGVEKILKQYPSIEVCIDLHRDGIPETMRLVTEIDGKTCAKVMLVNGICRLNKDGQAEPVSWLENKYIKENLAFSLQIHTLAGQKFPGFMRKNYLNPYRFILHYMPRSALIEVGAQTNTKQEALNAMEPLAKILAEVLLEDTP
ncbi:stage II sporulation protein P (SpoIIP) [Anaerotignum neopropionicum]|uniref:Stage II sporulation protein P (SpoIIP) n=1 Tax=Anaerotignum neopropionicum TaxID=36847 RepID=A0A136WIG5_9FIRM|nr:stage II sporulation protein P [Anaerotignum neopropionicum]KXL54267.1 stage II sporulation protein P (SpoIIP) [Anaerotignum neopropionicum]KXL54392.1 stage II sporulation protein P (SpoIIP) [Anaerotignum neopropionicum]